MIKQATLQDQGSCKHTCCRGRPNAPRTIIERDGRHVGSENALAGKNMVFSPVTRAKHISPHPYFRKNPPHWRVVKNDVGKPRRPFGCLVKGNALIGLAKKQGQPSLSLEDINKIQEMVAPRFAIPQSDIVSFDNTPRPYKNRKISESDRKDEILKYLYDTNGMKVTVKNEPEMEKVVSDAIFPDIPMDQGSCFPFNGPLSNELFPAAVIDDYKPEVTHMPGNFQIDVSDGRSPLSQLEEMKKQLPALAEQAKDPPSIMAGMTPDSPASSTSSGSSRENNEESPSRKPLLPYNGVGPILLWQFLLRCLVSGTHGICWTNAEAYEFKFTNPEAVARAWGECKPKAKKMTYEKMARSLRDYYKPNILRKVPEHRYVFQFQSEEIRMICRDMQTSKE